MEWLASSIIMFLLLAFVFAKLQKKGLALICFVIFMLLVGAFDGMNF